MASVTVTKNTDPIINEGLKSHLGYIEKNMSNIPSI
jgi:hypothetical protein